MFITLSGQRAYGKAGPQPITIADIQGISAIEELDGADARYLLEMVVELDRVFITDTYNKIAREQNKNKRSTNGAGNRRRT